MAPANALVHREAASRPPWSDDGTAPCRGVKRQRQSTRNGAPSRPAHTYRKWREERGTKQKRGGSSGRQEKESEAIVDAKQQQSWMRRQHSRTQTCQTFPIQLCVELVSLATFREPEQLIGNEGNAKLGEEGRRAGQVIAAFTTATRLSSRTQLHRKRHVFFWFFEERGREPPGRGIRRGGETPLNGLSRRTCSLEHREVTQEMDTRNEGQEGGREENNEVGFSGARAGCDAVSEARKQMADTGRGRLGTGAFKRTVCWKR